MPRIRVDLDLTDAQMERLVRAAVLSGFKRKEPRKAWTNRERREAAAWAVRAALQDI